MTATKTVAENLQRIKSEIARCCRESGRDASDVELMIVTKTVSPERIAEASAFGYRLFGENKVQEAAGKWTSPLLTGIVPDFIGHLQTNKVKLCLDVCGRIHSVDRTSLAETLDRELQKRGERREVFMQVNTSGEASKYGVPLNEAMAFARELSRYQTLKVTGLMTLALFSKDEDQVRSCFRRLKNLRSEILEAGLFSEGFKHLSMGMSSDYEIAIEEGATVVRLGQAIFGPRALPDSHYWPGEKS
jgi:pyridoxal phosphate enzyme (YggS family)